MKIRSGAESRHAIELQKRTNAANLQNNLHAILTALFKSNEKVTGHRQDDDGAVIAIELHMEKHQDKISYAPVEGSDKEWIAVERMPNCYDLFEASSFYDESGHPRYSHHPCTTQSMRNVDIIRGQELLNLLRQARSN